MKKTRLPIAFALVLFFFGSYDAHPYPLAQNHPDIVKINEAITALSKGRYDDAIRAAQSFIALQTNNDIGVSLFYGPDYPIVKEAFPNGPAERAGIKDADKIIKISGRSIKGWGDIKIREAFRGAPGTKILMTLERIGSLKPIQAVAVRGTSLSKEAAKAFGIRSLAYRYKSFPEGALDDAEKAMALNSGDEWACLSLAAVFLDTGRFEEAAMLLSPYRSVQALLLKAAAVFKQGTTQGAADIYSAIPEEDMPRENAMIAADREALLLLFKPLAAEHRAKARLFELKKQYPEALAELSEALKFADRTEAELVRDALFAIVRRNPSAVALPEEARKHALRGELQIKDGNFELAAKEYRMAIRIAPYAARLYYNLALLNEAIKNYAEAIRVMKIYLQAVPDALDARAAKDAIIKWEFEMEKGR